MKRLDNGSAAIVAAAAMATSAPAAAQAGDALPLLPLPASIQRTGGQFAVSDGAAVSARGAGAAAAARLLLERVRRERGLTLSLAPAGAIRIERDRSITGDERYRLTVTPAGIRIAAGTDAGLVHGAMTLAQLLSPDAGYGRPVSVPALAIDDAPRFRWRGYMADVARHFQPITALQQTVDQMAALKLNVLHLHLSDDHGWRMEIKRYPKLTEIGAWRSEPTAGGPASATHYGGFYTQAELKGLVAYAAERGITVVPEIDLPGHAQAIVASYPAFGVFGDRPEVSGDWGVNPYLIDPGPAGVAFVRNVLDELLAVFPSRYIHLGGDEAIKDQWRRSPRVQALMKDKGIASENALQSYLIREFEAYLRAHGRVLIGWDEILEGGGLPKSATVMSWQGEKGAIEASKAGHDVVLSPAPILYLDNIQAWLPGEPPMRPANPAITLERVYAYDAMPAAIAPADRRHVLGAQMNAWSEYLVTPERVWWATFPRLAAFAEGAWSPREARSFPNFLDRLEPQVGRWKKDGITAADGAFAVAYTLQGTRSAALKAARLTVSLANQTAHGAIRYTVDGSEPSAASALYASPLTVATGTAIRATTFGADGAPLSAARRYDTGAAALLAAGTNDLSPCTGGIELRFGLTPDAPAFSPAFNSNTNDPCLTWRHAPLSAASSFALDVVRLPRNLAPPPGNARGTPAPATRFGELLVRTGGCDTPPIATFPLPDPATAPNRLRFAGTLPDGQADGDLCMSFTARAAGPLYVVGGVQLGAAR